MVDSAYLSPCVSCLYWHFPSVKIFSVFHSAYWSGDSLMCCQNAEHCHLISAVTLFVLNWISPWRHKSSWIWYSDWLVDANVLQEHTLSIFSAVQSNSRDCIPVCTLSYPRRLESSSAVLWEPWILNITFFTKFAYIIPPCCIAFLSGPTV